MLLNLPNEVGLSYPSEPGGERVGQRQEAAQGYRAHLGTLPRRGHCRGHAARPGPLKLPERPFRVEQSWLEISQLSPLSVASSSSPPPQPTPLHRLPSPPCPALHTDARPSVCAQVWAVKASPKSTLRARGPLPAWLRFTACPGQIQEATIKPMSIMSPAYFRKCRSRPQFPQWKLVSDSHCEHHLLQPLHRCVWTYIFSFQPSCFFFFIFFHLPP